MIPGPRIRRTFFKALNILILPSDFLRSRCGYPFVPGHIPGSDRAVQPGTNNVLSVFRAW